MPKILKFNNSYLKSFTKAEADRVPNYEIGKHYNIVTNRLLLKDERLSQYVNNGTMGALDNFAQQEKLRIYITPLENDLFDDLSISVMPKGHNRNKGFCFAMKIPECRHSLGDFLTDLHKRIIEGVSEKIGYTPSKQRYAKKLSAFERFQMWLDNVSDRIYEKDMYD